MADKQTAVEWLWQEIDAILPSQVDSETGIKLYRAKQKALEMERPRWVQFEERKPPQGDWYFVKGKSGYGAYLRYFEDTGEFELGNLPCNKFADEYLQWLEE